MAITKATASSIAPAAKGDLVVGNATNDADVLAVGADGTTLVADSAEATGLKWAAAASANLDIDVITSGNLSGNSTISFTALTQNYLQLRIFQAAASGSGTGNFTVNVNNDTSGIYTINLASNNAYTTDFLVSNTATKWQCNSAAIYNNSTQNNFIITIFNCAASGYHNVIINGVHRQSDNANAIFVIGQGFVKTTAPITSVEFATTGNSWNAGTYELIGG